MKKDLSVESGFYLPPQIWVVEVHSEHFLCESTFNSDPDVDENHNINDGGDEGFDFEF